MMGGMILMKAPVTEGLNNRSVAGDALGGMSVLCAAGCVVLALLGAASAQAAAGSAEAGGFDGCDWTIVSETGNRSGQTREEVADRLAEELAIKLKQFDECAERIGSEQANADAADSSFASAAGGGSGQGEFGSNGASESGAGEEWDQVAQGERSGSRAGPPDAFGTVASRRQTGAASGPTAGHRSTARRTESVAGRSGRPPRSDPAEDDIARILREAAEMETDPRRKAELWREYDIYMENL